jgi:hypothetical protein
MVQFPTIMSLDLSPTPDLSDSSGLSAFYRNHSHVFLGRDPDQQRMQRCPETLLQLRDLLVHIESEPPDEDQLYGMELARQLYLYATGNIDWPIPSPAYFYRLRTLLKTHRIGDDAFGFLRESDPSSIAESMSLSKPPTDESLSSRELMRFCRAHGVPTGHDTRRQELEAIATWIINMEHDKVSLRNFPRTMQQAIDLAALAQSYTRFERTGDGLEAAGQMGIEATDRMAEEFAEIRRSVVELGQESQAAGERKVALDFQTAVLQSLELGKTKKDVKKTK